MAVHPGGEVGHGVPVEYVVDTPVSRRAMLALDADRALALREDYPHYVSKLARLSPLSCSPKHHVLMGWVDPEASSHANQPERRSTFAPRRAGTAAPVELVELVDGLPWLS